MSCDSVVAMTPLTLGAPLFAKNSDRPADECQPLLQVEAADHVPGTLLRCQYIEVDQVAHTHAFVGSRPYWLWGVEHGVNELDVAIGNHTIFTKDPLADTGLLGMDLVRLGLERGGTACEAVETIIELLERYGQGGSGYVDTVWAYHNSFLVADPREAFLLETSGKHWALRQADSGLSASNHVTIAADWSRLSKDCESHARTQGWWGDGAGFDFAAAYRETAVAPPIISSARYRATCAALTPGQPRLNLERLMRLMRDHNEGGELYEPKRTADDERYYSVCMHADPVGTTTASMVVELDAPKAARPVWVAFCNPCVAPYLPVFIEGRVPGEMQAGGRTPHAGGAWWRFKRLLDLAAHDWTQNAPLMRDFWREHEQALRASTERLADSPDMADRRRRAHTLTAFMESMWQETRARAEELETRLPPSSPNPQP